MNENNFEQLNKNNQLHQTSKYKNVDSFMPSVFDFIENYLLFEIAYVKRFDRVLNSQLEKMSFEHRKEKFRFLMMSESKCVLCLYFTFSYLAHMYKNSNRMDNMDQEIKIPLVQDMFNDDK